MSQLKMVVFLALVVFSNYSFSSATWPNEPIGSTPLLDCPFNEPTCGGQLWNPWGTPVIAQPSGAPLSPTNAIATHLAVNAKTGSAGTCWPQTSAKKPYTELYVGLWWKMNKDFQGYSVLFNKMFFITGTDSTNGVFGLYGTPDKFPWKFSFGPNTYGYNNSPWCGDGMGLSCMPNVTDVPIYRDTWYRLEAYVKSSTCTTCRDGIVRWWVDGKLAGDYRAMNYGVGTMNSFKIVTTWDGQPAAQCFDAVTNPKGRDCSREWFHYYDHIVISAPNCPAGGCTVPAYVKISGSFVGAKVGTAFSSTLSAFGGKSPYTYSIVSGGLQDGLSLSSSGTVSGTPTCGGRKDFTVKAVDADGVSGTASYSLVASGSPVCASAMIAEEMDPQGRPIRSPVLEISGGNVRFTLPGTGAYTLIVYDLAGSLVWQHSGLNGSSLTAHSTKLFNNGVYIARLNGSLGAYFQKFCVVR